MSPQWRPRYNNFIPGDKLENKKKTEFSNSGSGTMIGGRSIPGCD